MLTTTPLLEPLGRGGSRARPARSPRPRRSPRRSRRSWTCRCPSPTIISLSAFTAIARGGPPEVIVPRARRPRACRRGAEAVGVAACRSSPDPRLTAPASRGHTSTNRAKRSPRARSGRVAPRAPPVEARASGSPRSSSSSRSHGSGPRTLAARARSAGSPRAPGESGARRRRTSAGRAANTRCQSGVLDVVRIELGGGRKSSRRLLTSASRRSKRAAGSCSSMPTVSLPGHSRPTPRLGHPGQRLDGGGAQPRRCPARKKPSSVWRATMPCSASRFT